MLVHGISAHHGLQMTPTIIHQTGWDDVLDPCACVRSCDANQRLQIVGAESHHNWRHQSDEWKHDAVHHPRVGAPVPVEEGLPVVSKCDSDDWKVGADGEDWEKAQEVSQERDVQHVAVVREIEGVHVVQQGAVEAEDGGEGEEHVEAQDQDVVRKNQFTHMLLVRDGCHEGGQGVLTHEGVDAHAEQVGHSREVGGWWVTLAGAFDDADESQDDHHGECEPAHQRGENLKIFSLLGVEKSERSQQDSEDAQKNPVCIFSCD